VASGPKKPNDSFLGGLDTDSVDPFEEDDGLDFSVEDFLPEEDTAKFVRRSPASKAWGGVLTVFRFPEMLLGKIYRASPIRWLMMKFDWYRDLADQRELGSIIEDTYGGPRGVLFRMQRFFRHNILFTCLAVVGIYMGGRALMPMVFEQDAVRTALGVEEFDAEKEISGIKQANLEAKEILNRRVDLKDELQTCIVTETTRTRVLAAIGDDGYLDDANLLKALSGVRRFNESFQQGSFADATDHAAKRIAVLNESLSGPIANAKALALALKPKNQRLRSQGKRLERELDALEAKGSQDVRVVNEVIRVKDELSAHRDLMESGPSDSNVDALVARLDALSTSLGQTDVERIDTIDMVEPFPKWYLDMTAGDESQAKDAAARFDELGIQRYTGQFDDPSRAIVGDAVYQLSGLFDQALAGIRQIKHGPAVALSELIKEENSVNSQINRVMETTDEAWVDHRPCLVEQGVAIDVSVLD